MKGKNVIAFTGLIVIIGILSFMLLAPKYRIQMSAKYDHTQIAVSYAIPNPEQVTSAKLKYAIFYLENYKNVSPVENEIELAPNGDIQYIPLDTYDFLAKQDRMDLSIIVTYEDGKTLTKTHKLEHFFEKMVSDALVPSERHANRTVFEIEDIKISLLTSDVPEALVVYKSLSNSKRFFYIGYRTGNYLYPIKTFVMASSLNADSEVDSQWERIKFENQDEIDSSELLSTSSSKLYELPMISLDWVGLYPFDSKGELIPYESPNKEVGFVLIDGDFHSELFDVSYQQYTKWSQEIPAITFASTR